MTLFDDKDFMIVLFVLIDIACGLISWITGLAMGTVLSLSFHQHCIFTCGLAGAIGGFSASSVVLAVYWRKIFG